jgi:hypothetical protein
MTFHRYWFHLLVIISVHNGIILSYHVSFLIWFCRFMFCTNHLRVWKSLLWIYQCSTKEFKVWTFKRINTRNRFCIMLFYSWNRWFNLLTFYQLNSVQFWFYQVWRWVQIQLASYLLMLELFLTLCFLWVLKNQMVMPLLFFCFGFRFDLVLTLFDFTIWTVV